MHSRQCLKMNKFCQSYAIIMAFHLLDCLLNLKSKPVKKNLKFLTKGFTERNQ